MLATIPVGISGLALEHLSRTILGKPIPAAVFLTLNGIILYAGERLRRRARSRTGHRGYTSPNRRSAAFALNAADDRLAGMSMPQGW